MVIVRMSKGGRFLQKKAGPGVYAPRPAPSASKARHSVVITKSLHDTAQNWGLHPELLKAWNPGATFEIGSSVFIDPPKAS